MDRHLTPLRAAAKDGHPRKFPGATYITSLSAYLCNPTRDRLDQLAKVSARRATASPDTESCPRKLTVSAANIAKRDL
jgi:hypothetical protein